ncbi:MAG: hypothetical protein O3A80_05425 [bacterium]|nr:hypothetical protein [bacterium]
MKNTFKTTLVLLTVLLTACSSAPTQMQDMMDDHHKGEENVMPHGHEDEAMQDMMDDHHKGEENIEPHGHEVDSAPKPPSRSNTVDDHDDTGTDPHGH